VERLRSTIGVSLAPPTGSVPKIFVVVDEFTHTLVSVNDNTKSKVISWSIFSVLGAKSATAVTYFPLPAAHSTLPSTQAS